MNLDEAIAKLEEFGPNCLLGICCPPGHQRALLAEAIAKRIGSRLDEFEKGGERGAPDRTREGLAGVLAADFILDHFDLAPKDSLTPLLRKAGELALNGKP